MDSKKRSTLKLIGVLGLGYAAFQYVPGLLPEKLELVDLERPVGFRKFVAGDSSAGLVNPFVGLESDGDALRKEQAQIADARIADRICAELYAGLDLTQGHVPIASFSDYYCPFCRVQTKKLAELVDARGAEIAVAWHELPLLGENSLLAAKAALAAKRQGAYADFHARLMKAAFSPSPEYLSSMAKAINVDEARLLADMNSAEIALELENSAALSRAFQFIGTPALVIGRTVIQGQVSDKMIEKIITLEREEDWAKSCGYS